MAPFLRQDPWIPGTDFSSAHWCVRRQRRSGSRRGRGGQRRRPQAGVHESMVYVICYHPSTLSNRYVRYYHDMIFDLYVFFFAGIVALDFLNVDDTHTNLTLGNDRYGEVDKF